MGHQNQNNQIIELKNIKMWKSKYIYIFFTKSNTYIYKNNIQWQHQDVT